MAHLWHIRVRSWRFVQVHRLANLPFLFAAVRRIGLDDFPKLRALQLGSLTIPAISIHQDTVDLLLALLEREGLIRDVSIAGRIGHTDPE
jgi:hypothetical protein